MAGFALTPEVTLSKSSFSTKKLRLAFNWLACKFNIWTRLYRVIAISEGELFPYADSDEGNQYSGLIVISIPG
ncbi:MAG TPA: hypothetical protein VIX37_06490, partial [Candidatus Sulfotelmatobacter sp.]